MLIASLLFFAAQFLLAVAQDEYELTILDDTALIHPTSFPIAVYDGDETVYLLGGNIDPGVALTDTYKFHLDIESIVEWGKMPKPGAYRRHGAAVWTDVESGEYIYYFGGESDSEHNEIWRMDVHTEDPSTWEEVAVLQNPSTFMSAFWDGGDFVFVLGGTGGSSSIWKLKISTGDFDFVNGVLPAGGLYGAGMAWNAEHGRVYMFGGIDTQHRHSILAYDPAIDEVFNMEATLTMPLAYSCAVWANGSGYIIGGQPGNSQMPDVMVQRFTEETGVEELQVINQILNTRGSGCVYAELENRIYIFGGALTQEGGTQSWMGEIMYITLGPGSTRPTVPTTTVDPTTTTEDPITTTEEPTVTTEDPTDTTEDPTDTTEEPTVTTEDPKDTTEDPTDTTEEPTVTTEDPTDTTEGTTDTTEDPTDTTEEPTVTTEDPTDTTEGTTDTTEGTTVTTEDPTDTTEGTTDITEEPTITSEDPTTTTEGTTDITEDPTTTTEGTTDITEDPTTTTESTTVITEDPTDTTEGTTDITEDPTTTTEDPSITTEELPSPTDASAATSTKPPTPPTTEELPSPTDAPTTTSTKPPTPPTTEDPPKRTTTEEPNSTHPPDCSAYDKYQVLYEATAGEYAHRRCPGAGTTGQTSWYCLPAGGTFNGSNPDYSNCRSSWLEEIEKEVNPGAPFDPATAIELLRSMRENVENAADNYANNATYFGHEISKLFTLGELILELVTDSASLSQLETLLADTVRIFESILVFEDPWQELGTGDRLAAATIFLAASDSNGIRLGNKYKTQAAVAVNIPPYRKTIDEGGQTQLMSGMEPTASPRRVTFPEVYTSSDSSIELPSDWASHFPHDDQVSFTSFKLSAEYLNKILPAEGAFDPDHVEQQQEHGRGVILNGPLMAFTLDDPTPPALTDAPLAASGQGVRVAVTIQHDVPAWGSGTYKVRRKLHPGERPKAVLESARCVYWNPARLRWASDGCWRTLIGPHSSVCECDHLTSFAVIMDLHEYVGKDKALEIMTWILSTLSIMCLLACILVFLYATRPGQRQLFSSHPRNELTLHLCIALLVSNLQVLITMDKDFLHLSNGACIGAAIALHYTLLCSFAWMALEGVLLTKRVFVDVFHTGREHKLVFRVAGYLVPALIVGATCALNFARGDEAYGGDAYCWLQGEYLWGFMGPAATAVAFNTVVLFASVRKSYRLHYHSKIAVKRQAKSVQFWIQGSLNLTVIMGITWAFGFLMLIRNEHIARFAAYVFTAFNAAQGVFIFMFHVASNKKVRTHFSSIVSRTRSGGGETGTTNASKYSRKASRPNLSRSQQNKD